MLVITQRGSLMRQMVDDVLATGGERRVVAEVAHRTSLLPLVLAGLGHSVMPDAWRTLAEGAGCTVRPIEPTTYLDVGLVHRTRSLTPGAREFVRMAQGTASQGETDDTAELP